jgi:uncharacterized repeat protein (TIGR03803 family)
MDGSGNLYGVTLDGGANSDGTVFELGKGSSTITTLASFNGANGSEPAGDLVMDGSGNLYGAASNGGLKGDGTIFELGKGSNTITTLASFNGSNGADPSGSLFMDSGGNLYGTTKSGGDANNDGTLFELTKGSNTITTLAIFNGTNGSQPTGGPIMDSGGNLYGAASNGGLNGDGTIFELGKGSNTITTLASFNGSNGASPNGNLIMGSSGNLYGSTSGVTGQFPFESGGLGTVFELAKGSKAITTMASFTSYNEAVGGVIMDSSGNLYGTTSGVGHDAYLYDDTVFEVAKGSNTITTLASLGFGVGLNNDLTMDSSGNLFGTTDGPFNATVFELSPSSFVAADFAGSGIWRYEVGVAWQHLLPYDAQQVAVDDAGDVFARFGPNGVWRYRDSDNWQELSSKNANWLGVDRAGDVVVDFTGSGLYRYTSGSTTGSLLTAADATIVSLDPSSGDFAAEFPGHGVWRYEVRNGWQQLRSVDASWVGIDGSDNVVADFHGQGVWRYTDSSNWQTLTGADAAFISLAQNGDFAAEFTGAGVWRYNANANLQQILPYDAQQLAIDEAGDVTGDFGTNGLWRYSDATNWTLLRADNASIMGIDFGGDVLAGFADSGLWLYESSGHALFLTAADPSLIATNY